MSKEKEVVYVFPVPKTPTRSFGRFGPIELEDWRLALRLALITVTEMRQLGVDARLLIVSAFRLAGHESELVVYQREIRLLGYDGPVLFVNSGVHTGDQVKIAASIRDRHCRKAKLILFPTVFHSYHVWYYADDDTECRAVWGIPSLLEAPKDLLMPIVAWAIDRLGLRKRYEQMIAERRKKGKL